MSESATPVVVVVEGGGRRIARSREEMLKLREILRRSHFADRRHLLLNDWQFDVEFL